MLKPFDKSKKQSDKKENAVDDDVQKIPVSHHTGKNNYFNKDNSSQSNKTKNVTSNSSFSVNSQKINKRLGGNKKIKN